MLNQSQQSEQRQIIKLLFKMKNQNKSGQSKAAKSKRGANIMGKVQGDEVLVKLTGLKSEARCQYVKQIWRYIKKHQLQTKEDGRVIIPDKALSKLMGVEGKKFKAFTMARDIEKHLVKK